MLLLRRDRYIRVTRGDTGPGTVDAGYPAPISNWGWPAGFGASGIDAALYSRSKTYFFKGNRYIRVTRGDTGPGTVDPGYPAPISNWGWPAGFGASGIDAALYSGSKTYFFKGNRYIRVTRGDTGPGTVDPGYPAPISNWGWPAGFGASGIDDALYSGSKCYFFQGDRYVRVTRGDTGPGTVDPGYPASIASWRWPRGFAGSPGVPTVRLFAKVLTGPAVSIATAVARMQEVYGVAGIDVRLISTQNLVLPELNDVDVGECLLGQTTDEQDDLFANRDGAGGQRRRGVLRPLDRPPVQRLRRASGRPAGGCRRAGRDPMDPGPRGRSCPRPAPCRQQRPADDSQWNREHHQSAARPHRDRKDRDDQQPPHPESIRVVPWPCR